MCGEEIFRSGTLEMATQAWDGPVQAVLWTDVTVNRVFCLVSVALMVANLMDYIRLMPHLLFCANRSRGAEVLEHSLGLARTRNLTAFVYLLPLCLMIDRYATTRPSFWSQTPAAWSVPATIATVVAFLLLRQLCFQLFSPRRLSGESLTAIRRNPYNFLLLAAPVFFVTMGVIAIFHLASTTAWHILLTEIGVAWAFALVRSGQILSKRCSGLSTILYLCALELLPAATLVAVVTCI
ncbi:MAG: DUF4271 domain-containing protein [Bacteroidales bacterium]|nr:DUF4271 domain-containing protein [Bacteroidales bacterium]